MKTNILFSLLIILSIGANAQLKVPKTKDIKKAVERNIKSTSTKEKESKNKTEHESSDNKADTIAPQTHSEKVITARKSHTQSKTDTSDIDEKAEEEAYQKIYNKFNAINEMGQYNRSGSGQRYDDFTRMQQWVNNVSSEEVKKFPEILAQYESKNKRRAVILGINYKTFMEAYTSGSDLLKNMILHLKENYGFMDTKYFTTQKMDELIEGVKNGIQIFQFMADVFPDRTDYKSYTTQAKAMQDAIDKKLNAKYAANYTSAFHTSNTKKILLSNKDITIGKENPQQFKSLFTLGESIKAVVYTNEKIKTYNGGRNYVGLEIFFDEAISDNYFSNNGCLLMSSSIIAINDKETDNAYLTFDLIPDNTKTNHISASHIKRIASCMNGLLPGKHNVRLQVGFISGGSSSNWNSSNTFTVDFELDVTEEGLKAMAAKVEKIEAAELAAVRMEKTGMTDAGILGMVKSAASKNGHVPLRTVLVSNGWSNYTHKDALGRTQPSYQRIYAQYAFKDDTGKCFIQSVDIIKDYSGAGQYSKPYTKAGKEYRKAILCENVGK